MWVETIKQTAAAQGIGHTEWIINQCKISLNLMPEALSEGRILDLMDMRLKPIEAQLDALSKRLDALSSSSTLPQDQKPQSKAKTKAQPKPEPEPQATPEPEQPVEQPKTVAPKKLPKPLTSKELGERLEITNAAVKAAYNRSLKAKNPDKSLADYTQKRDPDKLAWVYDRKTRLFNPIKPTSTTSG